MIGTTYAVNCLKQGFQRYIRYKKINATIDCGDNYVSFYVKGVNGKQYLARGSNHHLKMQHLADKDEPWNGDNISVVFITPSSPQDTRIRGRVRQNHYGGIKPFSVTTYQYDNTILNESDLRQIFYAITVFLNGKGYTDPFAKTPKAAKVIPRNANIKPYKEPSPARNISVDKDGNYVSANAWGADYVSENKQYNTNRNMNKKVIRLTEADLHKIVKESVQRIVSEASATPKDYKHRFDPNKRDGDFPLEQPEWTKDPRWQGWNGEDPEWIMKQQEKYPYGGEIEQPVRVSEAQLRQIVKESVEQVMNEGVGDYFGAIRRGWNTPVKSYEFGNTKGALRAMDSIENRALQHQMNTERGIGLQGYNTKFEQDVKNWLRGDTVRINDKMSPKTQQYWRQVKAKADEILNNHGKEKVMGVLGAMRSRF